MIYNLDVGSHAITEEVSMVSVFELLNKFLIEFCLLLL
jgi:hypothetical protein